MKTAKEIMLSRLFPGLDAGKVHDVYLYIENDIIQAMEEYASQFPIINKPTDKQLVEIALLFNKGKIQKHKLTDMIAMSEFILDRLCENNDVTKKSSKEK